ATPSQHRVERRQRLGVESRDRGGTEYRPDVAVELADVVDAGRLVQLDDIEPPVQKLVERGLRPWVPLLVHLVEEPRPYLLRLLGGRWPGGHGLDEVVLLLGHRVDAGVDAYP